MALSSVQPIPCLQDMVSLSKESAYKLSPSDPNSPSIPYTSKHKTYHKTYPVTKHIWSQNISGHKTYLVTKHIWSQNISGHKTYKITKHTKPPRHTQECSLAETMHNSNSPYLFHVCYHAGRVTPLFSFSMTSTRPTQ